MTASLYTAVFVIILVLSLLSVVLIKFKLIPVKFSYPGLFFLVLLSLILTTLSKPELRELGMGFPSVMDTTLYFITTLVSCLLIYFLSKKLFSTKAINEIFNRSQWRIAFYVILSAPAQEFLFRSFLYYSLNTIGLLNILSMTIISSLLFGIAHLGYGDKYLNRGTFVLGAVWGVMYFIAPNLILISISHAIIGLFAFSQGLIKQQTFFAQAA